MKRKHRTFSYLLFSSIITLLLLLVACSAKQVKMSPTLAVLKTSAFSPDGKLIAAGRDMSNVVLLYDSSTASFKKALMGNENRSEIARSLSFSRDSRFLAAAGIDDTVVIWDMRSDEVKIRLSNLKGPTTVSFSPTQDVLAISGPENRVTLWKIPEGTQVGELIGHTEPVISIAFSLDGKMLATGSTDKTARAWSVNDQKEIRKFDGFEYPVHSVSFSPDGSTLATYSGDLKIWRWGNENAQTVSLPATDDTSVQTFASLVLLLAGARNVQLTGTPGNIFYTSPNKVAEAVSNRFPAIFSPDGKFLAVLRHNIGLSGDYEIVLLDTTTNTTKSVHCQCWSICFSPDGTKLAAAGWLGVKLLDPVTGNWIKTH